MISKTHLIHWLEEELKKARQERELAKGWEHVDHLNESYWQGRVDTLESVYLQVAAHPFAGKL